MKQIFHKIASIFLAFIVLLSSFSYTVNKHICGGKVANTTLFIEADDCGMDMMSCENYSFTKSTSFENEPCCQDISILIKGHENNQLAQQFVLEIPNMEFVTVFVYSFVIKLQETTTVSSLVMYKPPLVYKNIQTLFQVFRI